MKILHEVVIQSDPNHVVKREHNTRNNVSKAGHRRLIEDSNWIGRNQLTDINRTFQVIRLGSSTCGHYHVVCIVIAWF